MILGYLIWVDIFHVVFTSVQYRPNIFFLNNTLLKGLILKLSMCNNSISESYILNKNLMVTLPRCD